MNARSIDTERTMHDDALDHWRNCYADAMLSRHPVTSMQYGSGYSRDMNEHSIEPTIQTVNDDIAECGYCGAPIEYDGTSWWHIDYEPDICDWYMEDGTPCPYHTKED